jgi:hypothetical protein
MIWSVKRKIEIESSIITGAVIPVDGGYTAFSGV